MQQITQVACGDQYSGAATLDQVFNSSGGYFSIQNADAYVELEYGGLGQFFWTNEALVPIGNGVLQAGTTGVRFRNANAGTISTVTAALYAEAEPALIITAGGLATPSVNPGSIIASGTNTNPVTTAGTTFGTGADLLSAALTFTADGTTSYILTASAGDFANAGGNTRLRANLDGADAGEFAIYMPVATAMPVSAQTALTAPASGSHTINVRMTVDAGSATVQAGAGGAGTLLPILVVLYAL